jgi:hypothetical protein
LEHHRLWIHWRGWDHGGCWWGVEYTL